MVDSLSSQELESAIADCIQWSRLDFTFKEVASENNALVRNLAKYSPESAIPMITALLTLPKYQSICIRLETLATLAVVYCKGRNLARTVDVSRWLHMIQQTRIVLADTAMRDVFVHLVRFEGRAYRVIGGNRVSTGFFLQRILDVVECMPDQECGALGKETVKALLVMSDQICARSGLYRYQADPDIVVQRISATDLPSEEVLRSRTTFSLEDLGKTGIDPKLLETLILDKQSQKEIRSQKFEANNLLRKQLHWSTEDRLCVTLPSALAVTIREYIVSSCIDQELVDEFDRLLVTSYSRIMPTSLLLQDVELVPLQRVEPEDGCLVRVARIDQGYFVVLVFVCPTLFARQDDSFDMAKLLKDMFDYTFRSMSKEIISEVSSSTDFQRGRLVYVSCGWEQPNFDPATKELDPSWQIFHLSSADFDRLGYVEDMSLNDLWKILDWSDHVAEQGVELLYPRDLLSLVGCVQSPNSFFLLEDRLKLAELSRSGPSQLLYQINSLREVRRRSYQGHDTHFVRDDGGEFHTIQRVYPFEESDETDLVPLYYSLSDLVERDTLTSTFKGKFQIWTTLSITGTSNHSVEGNLNHLVNTCLERVGTTLDEFIVDSSLDRRVCRVDLEFEDPLDPTNVLVNPTADELTPYCRIEYSQDVHSAQITFSAAFMAGYRIAENIAERVATRQFIEAVSSLLGIPASHAESLKSKVVQNEDSQSIQSTPGHEIFDPIAAYLLPHRIEHTSVEISTAELGLAWRADDAVTGKISGKSACCEFLHLVVTRIGVDLIQELRLFNRTSTIEKLMLNIERADFDRSYMSTTTASTFGLRGNDNQAKNNRIKELSKIAEVIVSCRTLIEIAICTCSDGSNRVPADLDLSRLMAQVRTLIIYGGLSDAILFNILEPTVKISMLGQILTSNELEESILQPTFAQLHSDNFLAAAAEQDKHFEPSPDVIDISQNIDKKFVKTWKQDMGFNLQQGRRIVDALMNLRISRKEMCFHISKQTYLSALKKVRISKRVATAFLNQFSMEPRSAWLEPPEGFGIHDILPWVFGRKYSVLTRPVLKFPSSQSEETELILCPSAVKRAFTYVVGQAYRGRLHRTYFPNPNRWDSWLNIAQAEHTFTQQVSGKLKEIGWHVQTNLQLTTLLRKKLDQNYGEVDVLAWRNDKQEVLVVECKELAATRNLTERTSVLSQYQGEIVDGKRDKLRKHLDRMEVLNENVSAVAEFTRLDNVCLASCLIFSRASPSCYATIPALDGTFVGTIDDLIVENV